MSTAHRAADQAAPEPDIGPDIRTAGRGAYARTGTVRIRVPRVVMIGISVLVAIVVTFYGLRLATDVPFLATDTEPGPEDFASRYVAHPWLAYLHMTPGVLYLLGAPVQLSARIRTRHYTLHRRLGRVLVGAGALSVVLALVFGLPFPWGGSAEAYATAVFGCWFLACLLLAVRAIRRGDVVAHRRWMIRAFAIGVGVGVGTILIWMQVLFGFGLLGFGDSFGVAFWLAFVLHVLAAEWWLRATPGPGSPKRSSTRTGEPG